MIKDVHESLGKYFSVNTTRVVAWALFLPVLISFLVVLGDCTYTIIPNKYHGDPGLQLIFQIFIFLPVVIPISYSNFSIASKFISILFCFLLAVIAIATRALGVYSFFLYALVHDFFMLRACL